MKNSRTSMTNIVYQRMKRLHAQRGALLHLPVDDSSSSATTAWGRTISSLDYWRSHDSSTSAIACIAWIQHVQRTKELSFAAVRLCVDDGDAFMSCLELLAFQLCSHEYEQTRKDALKGFEAVSGRFGSKMLRMVRRLVDRLCLRDTNSSSSSPYPDKEVEIEMVAPVPTPALTYFTAAGTLSLLGQGRVQKRIVGDMELLEYVLRSLLLHSQEVLLGCTTEPDKQEKLMHSLVELLIKYLKHWCIHPQTENGYMRRLALTCVGFYPPTMMTMMMEEEEVIRHSDEDLLSAFIADILKGASSHAAGATGLRLESFASFMVLHSIGRPTTHELPLPNSSSAVANDTVLVWKWVLQTLLSTQQQGQPSQTMALASMSRLAWLTYLEQQPQGAGSVYCRSIPYVRSMLSPTSPHCCLRSLLTSASQSHPRDSDDGLSAQWGRGISQMIQAAKFMWMIFPRRLYGYACRQMYSSKFRKEDAAMYMSLVLSGLMGSTDELFSSSSTYTSGAVGSSLGQLFSLTDHLPAANEGEERANNTTRAELFAGIYRAYRTYCSKTAPAVTSSSCSGDRDGSEQVLLSFFRSSVEKASLDYSKDWQEAVYFALADIPCQRGASSSSTSSSSSTPGVDYFSELIPTYIVDKVQQLLISQQQTQTQTDLSSPSSSSSAAASAVESDQVGSASDSNSFASQAKVLQFATALLLADQEACYSQLTLGPQQSGVEQDKVASSSTSSIAPSMKDSQSQVGLVLLQLLEQQDGSSLISPFRSTRLELAHLLTLLALNNSDGQQQAGQQVSNTLQKIAVACQQFNLKLSLQQQQQQQQPSPEEETGTVDVTSQSQLAVSEATHTAAASAVLHKNTAETVCLLVSCGIQRLPMWRVSVAMRSLTLSALLSAGSMTSSALETARMCHGTCMLVTGASVRTFNPSIPSSFNSSIPEDLCAQLLQLFDAQSKDPTVSLHSKETLVKCTALLMGDNWFCLSNDERKVCKDIFARGLDDPKPEVQQLAQAGMIAYLSYKSVSELASIAAIYTKNSDILADRFVLCSASPSVCMYVCTAIMMMHSKLALHPSIDPSINPSYRTVLAERRS